MLNVELGEQQIMARLALMAERLRTALLKKTCELAEKLKSAGGEMLFGTDVGCNNKCSIRWMLTKW
jgi:hypothetical protein